MAHLKLAAAAAARARLWTALIGLVILSAVARPLEAQPVEGVVLRPDSTPVAGALVELHRITETEGGVADSMRTDREGRFRFEPGDPIDPAAVWIPSVRHDGVLYWGSPVHGGGVAGDPVVQRVAVFDTASVEAPVSDLAVSMRHVVLTPTVGGLQVQEVIDLAGRGERTLVAASPDTPLWTDRLANDARGVLPAEGGVAPADLILQENAVSYAGVLPPGGVRIAIGYFVPASRFDLTVTSPTERLEVLVVDSPGLELEATGLARAPVDSDVGSSVVRLSGAELRSSTTVTVAAWFEEPGRGAAWTWFLVALVLAAAALASARLVNRGARATRA